MNPLPTARGDALPDPAAQRRAAVMPGPAAPEPTVRAVAWLEAAKGVVVLAAASGLLSLLHRDVYAIAAALIEHAHLNPAAKYPQIFLDAAAHLGDTRLRLLALGAFSYATLRLIEAWGLFRERPWAEVFAALSGAVYVPFEVVGLLRRPSWHGAALLLLNLAIVGLMLRAVRRRRAAAVTSTPAHRSP